MEANLQNLKQRMPRPAGFRHFVVPPIAAYRPRNAAKFEQQIKPFGLNERSFGCFSTCFRKPDGTAHPSDLCVRASQTGQHVAHQR